MKQSALTDRRRIYRLSLIVCALACLGLSLSASLLLTIPVRGEREETASSSIGSAQATPQTRALLTQKDAQAKNFARKQSRFKRPLTHIAASPGNPNASGHSLARCYSPDSNTSLFSAPFSLSWQQGRAPPRTI